MAAGAVAGAVAAQAEAHLVAARPAKGVLDAATLLPSFRHPLNAAYVFGPERSSLSPAMVDRCAHVVRITTRFCINLAAAGATRDGVRRILRLAIADDLRAADLLRAPG